MADLIANEGSFAWAMLQLKSEARVTRLGWCGKNMFLLRNPGLVGQVVAEGDFRAKAGIPVDTVFDYLPNIEIYNADGNIAPWVPTQVDIEAADWALVEEDQHHMLIVDVKNGYLHKVIPPSFDIEYWGYSRAPSQFEFGELSLVENNIYLDAEAPVYGIHCEYGESTVRQENGFVMDIHFSEEHFVEMTELLSDKGIKVTVGNQIFELGKATTVDSDGNTYALTFYYNYPNINDEFNAKLKETEQIIRYCFDWYNIDE